MLSEKSQLIDINQNFVKQLEQYDLEKLAFI